MQFQPHLARAGIDSTVSAFLSDRYLERLYANGRRDWREVIRAYARRLKALRSTAGYDLVWIDKELLPWLPFAVEQHFFPRGVRTILDMDDAIFVRYMEHRSAFVRRFLSGKFARLLQLPAHVIAGSAFLCDYARSQGARQVHYVPSVVDLEKYPAPGARTPGGPLVIGWIGSPSTQHYLHGIRDCLARVGRAGGVKLLAIGARGLHELPLEVELRSWSEETEAADLRDCDIGIMPLADSNWERGKCGYKLVQYMACGLPVVATAIGANNSIVRHGVEGYLARTDVEWFEHLGALLQDRELRLRMGKAGRARVESEYSLQSVLPRIIALIRD
ncbi:MAG: glycosyltransferase family 4 protein [Gammaproteobacteria bacterium]|nr:glycosyltransferase family 4 protein [Gammaproteobacteria bacterium]